MCEMYEAGSSKLKSPACNCPTIKLRPHHGLCIYHFKGNGYNKDFIENMTNIIKRLKANPKAKIQLTVGVDAICEYCPNNHQGLCLSDEKVTEYDQKCLAYCGLQDGQVLTWDEYDKTLTGKALYTDNLADVCCNCQWYEVFCS